MCCILSCVSIFMRRNQGSQIYFNKFLIVGCLNYVSLETKPKVNENLKSRKKKNKHFRKTDQIVKR